MLTPRFFAEYRAVPTSWFWGPLAGTLRGLMGAVGFEVDVQGAEHLPKTPALLCTNSTHTYDFLALMKGLDQVGRRVVSVTKAKNFHNPAMAFAMKRTGTIPLASRGYLIMVDFVAVHGRRPDEREYRMLRDHLDDGAPLPDEAPFRSVLLRPRVMHGVPFDASQPWREVMLDVFRRFAAESVRLARTAIDAGALVQIYPEGTVSPRLGIGRGGAVQLAHALGVPLLPVGMSGCPQAFFGQTPLPASGRITLRVGPALEVALPDGHRAFEPGDERRHASEIGRATARVMGAIDSLLDDDYRHAPERTPPGKGLRALL